MANESKICPQAYHALLLEHYKTPYYPLQGGPLGLQGMSPLGPPLPGKAIKATLFYFTQNSVSAFLVSTYWEAEAEFQQQGEFPVLYSRFSLRVRL